MDEGVTLQVSGTHPRGLSGNWLKIIAMISMLADHIGVILLPQVGVLRMIGRLAYPIFAYMIAEGCRYTKNRALYLGQIGVLGLGCQIVCAFFANGWHLNILITFSMAILLIYGIEGFVKNRNAFSLTVMILTLATVGLIELILPEIFAEQGFHPDYGALGVMLPVLVYFARGKWGRLFFTAIILLAMGISSGGAQWWGLAALPLLALYNGRRGRLRLKYLFYVFYPAHLAVLYLLDMLLG